MFYTCLKNPSRKKLLVLGKILTILKIRHLTLVTLQVMTSPEIWLRLQLKYDLWQAKQRVNLDDVEVICDKS